MADSVAPVPPASSASMHPARQRWCAPDAVHRTTRIRNVALVVGRFPIGDTSSPNEVPMIARGSFGRVTPLPSALVPQL